MAAVLFATYTLTAAWAIRLGRVDQLKALLAFGFFLGGMGLFVRTARLAYQRMRGTSA